MAIGHAGCVRRALAAIVVLAAVVVAGVAFARTQGEPRPLLAQALDTVPEVTQTANFTDWRQVRDVLDMPSVTSESPAAERQALLDAAYEQDLLVGSSLVGSVDGMVSHYGWSVLDADWDMFAQSREGAVSVLALRANVDFDALTAGLARLGYTTPTEAALDGGIWHGGTDLVPRIDPLLTPGLAEIAVLADRRLVVASDDAAYAARTVAAITSGVGSLGEVPEVAATAVPLYGAAVAVVHQLPRACEITSFASTDAADQSAAVQRAEEAGPLAPQRGLGFGVQQQGSGLVLDVVLRFASEAQAADQAPVRERLATGEAVGQGGTYDERCVVSDARVQGQNLLLELRPVAPQMSLLSDLTSGPLLFTWCGPTPQAVA